LNGRPDGVPANDLLVSPAYPGLELSPVLAVDSPAWDLACTWCAEPGQYPTAGVVVAIGCTVSTFETQAYVSQPPSGALVLENPTGGEEQKFDFTYL